MHLEGNKLNVTLEEMVDNSTSCGRIMLKYNQSHAAHANFLVTCREKLQNVEKNPFWPCFLWKYIVSMDAVADILVEPLAKSGASLRN